MAPEVGDGVPCGRGIVTMRSIEAGATGGSIAAGREALRMGVPLFVPEYAGMPETTTGNRELLREGGRPLLRSRSTMRAKLDPVFDHTEGVRAAKATGPRARPERASGTTASTSRKTSSSSDLARLTRGGHRGRRPRHPW